MTNERPQPTILTPRRLARIAVRSAVRAAVAAAAATAASAATAGIINWLW